MFDTVGDLMARPDALDAQSADVRERSPEQAGSYTCPHCSYANWCTFDAGHGGDCHCDQGHYWSGNH